ncbi:hypothetical protein KSP39_PZI018000 [Platanthera zijinensis]|uniref:AT-hook motif nuclear-localized protein n=1 Tax=Platanthera zijinensis TaxID=2320716 RepID=A0AAP0FZ25_9ASPA
MTVPSLSAVGEQLKKKRGRPRKYSTDGPMPLALTTVSLAAAGSPGGGCFSSPSAGQPNQGISFSNDPLKKGRGRPRGSTGKKQQRLALGNLLLDLFLFTIVSTASLQCLFAIILFFSLLGVVEFLLVLLECGELRGSRDWARLGYAIKLRE